MIVYPLTDSNTKWVCTYQSCSRFDEPVKTKLWGIPNGSSYLIVDILPVKAKFMQHTYLHKKEIKMKNIFLLIGQSLEVITKWI